MRTYVYLRRVKPLHTVCCRYSRRVTVDLNFSLSFRNTLTIDYATYLFFIVLIPTFLQPGELPRPHEGDVVFPQDKHSCSALDLIWLYYLVYHVRLVFPYNYGLFTWLLDTMRITMFLGTISAVSCFRFEQSAPLFPSLLSVVESSRNPRPRGAQLLDLGQL